MRDREGVVIGYWPGDIKRIGRLIGSIFGNKGGIFEVFVKVGGQRCYGGEQVRRSWELAALPYLPCFLYFPQRLVVLRFSLSGTRLAIGSRLVEPIAA